VIGGSVRAGIFSLVASGAAVLIHNALSPYGLFLAIAVVPVVIHFLARGAISRVEPLVGVVVWFVVAYIASTNRNGNEILVQGDTNGNAFLVGTSALVVLVLISGMSKRQV